MSRSNKMTFTPKENLLGKDAAGLTELIARLTPGQHSDMARQAALLFKAVYKDRLTDFNGCTSLRLALRNSLAEQCCIELPAHGRVVQGADGTAKFLFNGQNGRQFESVWLPFEGRTTLCISSQAGCSLDCSFCATGKLAMKGNLSVADITGQVWQMEKAMGRRATNIVFMGMGEPFYNYDNVIQAARILSDDNGMAFARRKITVSTAGVVPRIRQYSAERQPFSLAVSLNHSHDEARSRLMPLNWRYPMAELRQAIAEYNQLSGKAVFVEYVMIAGENISDEDARRLVAWLRGLKVRLNLIPLNTDFHSYRRPSDDEVDRFFSRLLPLRDSGIPVINRRSPARSIDGACGMLALKTAGS